MSNPWYEIERANYFPNRLGIMIAHETPMISIERSSERSSERSQLSRSKETLTVNPIILSNWVVTFSQ